MTINPQSWHYRLYRYIWNLKDGPPALRPGYERARAPLPRSLCPYFWSIVFGLIGVAIFGVVILVVEGVLIVAAAVLVACRALGGASASTGWSRFARRVKGVSVPELEPKKAKVKRPSLLGSAVRAQKDKVCPLIELED